MESHPTTARPRPWTGVVLVGVVIVCLAAAFVLLEQDRREKLTADCVRLRKSVDGEVVAATFLDKDVTAEQLDFIEQYPRIESLSFSNTRSVEGGLQRLRRIERLKSLDLSRTEWLDATVLRNVARLPSLEHLSMAHSHVTDSLLSELSLSRRLQCLNLDGCEGITDAAISTLQQMSTLREVWIEETGVTLQGFRQLRNSRPDLLIDCEIEQFLDVKLRNGSLSSSASAEDLSVLLELPHDWIVGTSGSPLSLHDVIHLSLSGPSAAESMKVLAPRLSGLRSLSIPAAALAELDAARIASVYSATLRNITPDDDLSNLSHIALLDSLELEVVAPLSAPVLQQLAGLRNVKGIRLCGPAISGPLLAALAEIPALRSLRMRLSSPLSTDALQSLTTFADLEALTLRGPGLTAATLAALAQMRTLRSIYLKFNSPPDAAAFHKLTTLPRLTHLGLEGPGVSNDLVMSLTRFPFLTQVHLANAPVSDVALLPFLNVAAPPRLFSKRTKLTLPMIQRVSQAGENRAAEQGISQ